MHANGGMLVWFVENCPAFTHQSRSVPGYSCHEVAGFEPMIAALSFSGVPRSTLAPAKMRRTTPPMLRNLANPSFPVALRSELPRF